ncbi:MAG: putative ABC transporter permease subunit [Gaiellales bacterium]
MRFSGVLQSRLRLAAHALGGGAGTPGRGRLKNPLVGWVLAAVLGGFFAFGFASLFEQLSSAGATSRESATALGYLLTAALIGLLVFDLDEAVAALLLDSDLELLRRAPLSGRALFTIKLLDAFPRTSKLLVVLVLPASLAYAALHPLAFWGWALLPIQILALWAIPLGLGVTSALHLLRSVPARRARDVLGVFSTLIFALIWVANWLLLPRLSGMDDDLGQSLRETMAVRPAWLAVSPADWAATAVGAAADSDFGGAVVSTFLLVLGAALTGAMALSTAARTLESVQAKIAVPVHAVRRRPWTASVTGNRPTSFPLATLSKDARLLLRDWTVLGDVLVAATLWTLLPLAAIPLADLPPGFQVRAMLLALTVGLGYEVATRAVPFERSGAAWIRLAPVPVGRWVAVKMTGAAVVSLPLMGLAGAALQFAYPMSFWVWIEIAALVVPALGLSLAFGLWTGVAFADFRWTNPRAMITLSGRLAASMLLIVQAVGWLGLAAVLGLNRGSLPGGLQLYGPLVMAALAGTLPIRATTIRLSKLEWSY